MGILAPIGRFLFSVLFLTSGMNHFMQYDALVGYARASGVPSPDVAVLVSGVVLVVGGVCVLLGAFARLGALLIVYFGPGPYSLGRRAERFASRIQIPLNRRG